MNSEDITQSNTSVAQHSNQQQMSTPPPPPPLSTPPPPSGPPPPGGPPMPKPGGAKKKWAPVVAEQTMSKWSLDPSWKFNPTLPSINIFTSHFTHLSSFLSQNSLLYTLLTILALLTRPFSHLPSLSYSLPIGGNLFDFC